MQRPEKPRTFYSKRDEARFHLNATAVERMITRRIAMGLSQEQLAEQAAITPLRMREIEAGLAHLSFADVVLIAAALKTKTQYFTQDQNKRARRALAEDEGRLQVVGKEAG